MSAFLEWKLKSEREFRVFYERMYDELAARRRWEWGQFAANGALLALLFTQGASWLTTVLLLVGTACCIGASRAASKARRAIRERNPARPRIEGWDMGTPVNGWTGPRAPAGLEFSVHDNSADGADGDGVRLP